MKYTILICLLFLSCICRSQQTKVAVTDYSQGKVLLLENNQIIWSHPAPESNDLWVLYSGSVLFTAGKEVLEINPQTGDTLFRYCSESPIFACQRLENGNTFVGECVKGRLLEISPAGKIIKEVSLLSEKQSIADFAFMRNARRLANGNFLVAHYGAEKVCEYNPDGHLVKEIVVPGGPHSVIRLSNGNTLISVADKRNDPKIIELNPQGETVWELSNRDISGAPLKFLGGMHLLNNGDLWFANWVGHVVDSEKKHLFKVNRNKQVDYALETHDSIQTVSSVFVILPETSVNH